MISSPSPLSPALDRDLGEAPNLVPPALHQVATSSSTRPRPGQASGRRLRSGQRGASHRCRSLSWSPGRCAPGFPATAWVFEIKGFLVCPQGAGSASLALACRHDQADIASLVQLVDRSLVTPHSLRPRPRPGLGARTHALRSSPARPSLLNPLPDPGAGSSSWSLRLGSVPSLLRTAKSPGFLFAKKSFKELQG